MMCVHETSVSKLNSIEVQESRNINMESEQETNYWDTVMEDDLNEEYRGKSMNASETEYVSRKSRSIFSCPEKY